jgi:L-alanine-DL-glutamate epimerase-like enolase superfamily enzyme
LVNLSSSSLYRKINQLPERIDEVELFRLDANPPGQIQFGPFENRQHAALRLCVKGTCGWSEGVVTHNDPSFQLAPWGACFAELKGMTVAAALSHHRQHRETWWVNQLEMAEIALLDLAGRLMGISVLSLLEMEHRLPVPGIFCIRESDPLKVAEQVRAARRRNLTSHIKIKIYGEPTLDTALIEAVRKVAGSGTRIIGAADGGFVHEHGTPLDDLATQLKALYRQGLYACEDPADLTVEEWIDLQSLVGSLNLIPNKLISPAWQAVQKASPDMGRIYNLNPGKMGSLIAVLELARRLQNQGAWIAIGDDGLLGPGCTIWQQVAIGLGAAWIQALEKPQESDVFLRCVQIQSTIQKSDGLIGLLYDDATRDLRPGFGLQVNVELLRKLCSAYCSI